jgi:hypothetical protein
MSEVIDALRERRNFSLGPEDAQLAVGSAAGADPASEWQLNIALLFRRVRSVAGSITAGDRRNSR